MESTISSLGGVQSLHRALDLLEVIAAQVGPISIGDLATIAALPQPTVHRLLRTLVDRGYVRQVADRRYALGYRLIPLGERAARRVGTDAGAVLDALVDRLGESANLAVLSGDRAEYVAQSPSPHAMRMFTEVGRRVPLHSTGVGKALLAQLTDAEIAGVVRRAGLAASTEHTITTEAALKSAVDGIRATGVSLDEQEQEIGVRCVAVPLPPGLPVRMAVSVSGPAGRMTDELVERAVVALRAAARELGASIDATASGVVA